ncbi:MAG TPA: ABC transporter permease [Lachnospiraceae bacterium]|nr:ABC transporter permease [Lachnospiraceae bacterium]
MKKRRLTAIIYLLPVLIIMAVFMYIPIIQNFYNSFFNWSVYKPGRTFVGLKYFNELIHDEVFWTCIINNTLYALISLVGQVGFGLIIAVILESKMMRGVSGFFRTVYFVPSVISFMVVGLLWQLFFNPNVGPFNHILAAFGVNTSNLNILGNANTALFGVIFASQWMYFGYMAMLLIVGIQKVPEELYEAAEIDGANAVSKFFHVTIPNIKEMILVDCIITVVGSFKLFDEIFIMTNGGPGYASEVLSTYLYRTAFRSDQMGYASSIAVVLFVITFTLSLIQIKISRTGEE